MISSEDIDVTVQFGTWVHEETISKNGYQPERTEVGLRVSVRNRSSASLHWCNVDVGLVHNSTVNIKRWDSERVGAGPCGHDTIRTAGVESFTTSLFNIAPGETKTIYPNWRSKHVQQSDMTSWIALRCYGGNHDGKFKRELSTGNQPAVSVTSTRTVYTIGEKSCFIANAAFDDPCHPTVDELRRVRDEVLRPSRSGRRFIRFYYRHSPRIAAWMSSRPRIKRAARAILTPLARVTTNALNRAAARANTRHEL
jgi:hypothetical protein